MIYSAESIIIKIDVCIYSKPYVIEHLFVILTILFVSVLYINYYAVAHNQNINQQQSEAVILQNKLTIKKYYRKHLHKKY